MGGWGGGGAGVLMYSVTAKCRGFGATRLEVIEGWVGG